ncbi:hypothetical protein L9F63_007543, partial [Diploptera punctata]
TAGKQSEPQDNHHSEATIHERELHRSLLTRNLINASYVPPGIIEMADSRCETDIKR